ncbi:MAG TPA: hypothetical protein VF757_09855 [Sphingomicrobium sp.]
MRKQQIENAAYEVATQVRAVEDTIDAALVEIAELQARMMHASSVAASGYGTIHPALQQLSAAVAGLVDSRGAIVACHVALAEAKQKVPGLRTVGWGDVDQCPPKTATAPLRVVA